MKRDYSSIKPIETVYDGYRFRSRLEARWAVFFKNLGIPFEYEPEGYNLDGGGLYLPDFYLPTVTYRNTTEKGWYIEIKPDEPTDEEGDKCTDLAWLTWKPVCLFVGPPFDPWESSRESDSGYEYSFRGDQRWFQWDLCLGICQCPNNHTKIAFIGGSEANCVYCGEEFPVHNPKIISAVHASRSERFDSREIAF